MMRYDKSYLNKDAKDFSDYEKDGPSRNPSHMHIEPHHHRGAIQRTHHPTRPPYPQNFQSSNPPTVNSTAPTTSIPSTNLATMTQFNPMYPGQQQLTPQQQYVLMAQMQMMQMMQQQGQYPQMNPYGAQPGQYPNGMAGPVPTMDPNKKEGDDKGGETNQGAMPQPSANQYNGNSYYRDIYNSHGNSYYNQQVESQSHGMMNGTMNGNNPYVKRPPGTSRFSDIKPPEPNTAGNTGAPQENGAKPNESANQQVNTFFFTLWEFV